MNQSHRFSCRQVDGLGNLLVEEFIKEADVGKSPSGHDGVITPTRTVRVEVSGSQTVKTKTEEQKFKDTRSQMMQAGISRVFGVKS